ncbi:hypothetical protein BD309DRAFT_964138 [Dichomitus squalens]|nr:hypothetical protein BD309DRAFT_964138 [Dichomitus squalens]
MPAAHHGRKLTSSLPRRTRRGPEISLMASEDDEPHIMLDETLIEKRGPKHVVRGTGEATHQFGHRSMRNAVGQEYRNL